MALTDLFSLFKFPNPATVPIAGVDSKQYRKNLEAKTAEILQILNDFLPSNYISTIPSTTYAVLQKTYAQEFAKLSLQLQLVVNDISYYQVRPQFIYQNFVSLLYIANQIPFNTFSDVDFQNFATSVLNIYLGGSTLPNILKGVELFTGPGNATILENYLLAREPNSGLDISDEFGFQIKVLVDEAIAQSLSDTLNKIRVLVTIIKPAHTIFTLSLIFTDFVDTLGTILDNLQSTIISDYNYDDIRKFCGGIMGQQRLGQKTFHAVVGESVTI